MIKIFLPAMLCLTISLSAQNKENQFTVFFYNVENLFDIYDHPEKMDEEFTPESEKVWNKERYEKKLQDIARVIESANPTELPEIIGLCEVENKVVLEDLVATKQLKNAWYAIVHEESPDVRGIDVALLYRTDEFKLMESRSIPIAFPFDSSETTRDILYVTGETLSGGSLHFFINHWSSRRGGMAESEPKRLYAAVTLRKEVDLLLNKDLRAKIVIMGDFNDEPTNRSVFGMLMANNKRKNASERDLYNLMYDLHNIEGAGTYNFRGTWNMLDQIIVSQAMLRDRSGWHTSVDGGKILREDWMLYEDENLKDFVPNRTYGGPEYYGGISDHLPVYVTLVKGNKQEK